MKKSVIVLLGVLWSALSGTYPGVFSAYGQAASSGKMSAETRVGPPVAARKLPFGAGEELIYTVTYRAALVPPINIMRVSMRTLAESLAGVPHFHVVGNGRTVGTAASLFSINDTYHSWIDARTLLPTRMTSDIVEQNYRMTATYSYDWRAMRVSNVRRSPRWESEQRASFELPNEKSGDALSLLYKMRTIDVDALVRGAPNTISLVLANDAKPIVFRYLGRERLKIKRLGTFRALKFSCTMATSDGSTYEEGMSFVAWFSDDDNKIPIRIESPIRVGRVTVTIADGFKTVHPLSSLEK